MASRPLEKSADLRYIQALPWHPRIETAQIHAETGSTDVQTIKNPLD